MPFFAEHLPANGRLHKLLGPLVSHAKTTPAICRWTEFEARSSPLGLEFFQFPLRAKNLSLQRSPEIRNPKLDLMELVSESGGDFMHVTPEGLVLSFQVRPKLPVLEGTRLVFEGLFDSEVLQIVASPGPKSKNYSPAAPPR